MKVILAITTTFRRQIVRYALNNNCSEKFRKTPREASLEESFLCKVDSLTFAAIIKKDPFTDVFSYYVATLWNVGLRCFNYVEIV